MAGGEESSGAVSAQNVWVLSVSIHCEGCKKKIKRILSKVHGVSDVVIEGPQKKVTVTGSVEGDALVKRLAKFHKHAVLLPESKPAASSNADTATGRPKDETGPKGTQEAAPAEKPAAAPTATADENAAAGDAPAAEPAKTTAEAEKKSGKKRQSDDKKAAPAKAKGKTEEKKAPKDGEGAAARSRDVGDMHRHPAHQAQPDSVMSYNVARPNAGQAYYAPPMQGYGAYNPYPQYVSPPPEFYSGSARGGGSSPSSSQHPAHIFDTLFSEENPNGCAIM